MTAESRSLQGDASPSPTLAGCNQTAPGMHCSGMIYSLLSVLCYRCRPPGWEAGPGPGCFRDPHDRSMPVPGLRRSRVGSSHLRRRSGVNAHFHVVQQTVPHGPDHQLLLRTGSQLVLNAKEGIAYGHWAVTPHFGNLGVRPAAGEKRQGLQLQLSQLVQGVAGGEPTFTAGPW